MLDQMPDNFKLSTTSYFEVKERKAVKKAVAEAMAEMKAEAQAAAQAVARAAEQAAAQRERETIISMYEYGLSIERIARIIKLNEQKVYDILQSAGLV
jgi:DNA invertase Pin-like site-specific DNA recombinase